MLAVSTIVGNYRILGIIGHGGFATVYRAEDLRLGRTVALKVLHVEEDVPEQQRQERIARFRREATAAASLNHPNIVTIYEIGDWEGLRYIAMEMLTGETLRAHLERKKTLSAEEALPIVEQVCAALEHAHQNNLIHRDVKPDNIFLLPDGRVKLADFGIARLIDSTAVTLIGSLVGSPAYMSPEQIAGEKLDQRADIFSLGITLYEVLSGRRPFESETLHRAMHAICHSDPAPLTGVAQSVQEVLNRALEKEPGRRYPSMSAFIAAFREAVVTARSAPSAPARRSNSFPKPSASRSPLQERVRQGTGAFAFDALIEGVSTLEPPKEEPPPGGTAMPSRSAGKVPVLLGALGVLTVILLVGLYATRARTGSVPTSAAIGERSPLGAGTGGSVVRFRLPAGPTAPTADSEVQAPVFVLSDFERAQGRWQPDTRQPASRRAFVQRVRNRAQQGAYWLKMDGLTFGSGASQAGLTIQPDTANLLRHGPTLSAALFAPPEAPEGMQAALAVEDPQGNLQRQPDSVPLRPGKWTTVRWEAGSRLQSVRRLMVLLNSGGKTYEGYVGLDNVQLREAESTPAVSTLKAFRTSEGAIRFTDRNRLLTQLGMVVCGPSWQITTASPHVKFRLTPRVADRGTLEVQVEATPQRAMPVRALAAEILLPKALYGSAHLDLAATADRVSSATYPLLLTAMTDRVQIARELPSGFTLKLDSPLSILLCEDVVPTVFTYTADRPLQSVYLAGPFNNWSTSATPMTAGADGRTWTTTVLLAPGEQQYKFVLNGSEWITDPNAAKNVTVSGGYLNSVRYVPRAPGSGQEPVFRLWVALAGRADGSPVTLKAGETLRTSFRLAFNQPFASALGR